MEINPKDPKTDQIGNLARAALFLGKGERELGLSFLQKSPLFPKFPLPQNHQEELVLAEQALDLSKREIFKIRGLL